MEQIVKRGNVLYYGEEPCKSVDDAYRKFRDDYHRSLGRSVYKRLDRLGQRHERIHGYGFVFSDGVQHDEFKRLGRVRYTISLVVMCYCRQFGLWDMPDVPDEQFDLWFDWAFTEGNRALMLVRTRDRTGRTSRRIKTRYR